VSKIDITPSRGTSQKTYASHKESGVKNNIQMKVQKKILSYK
jgi:hypothetical protein